MGTQVNEKPTRVVKRDGGVAAAAGRAADGTRPSGVGWRRTVIHAATSDNGDYVALTN